MLCRYVSLGRFVMTVCQHGHGAIPAPLRGVPGAMLRLPQAAGILVVLRI